MYKVKKDVVIFLTERQILILKTIIRDYTDLGQPIGSKTLQEQLPIRVSSATIRNEMAVLEKQGFITKEHSSSGRIPSLKGRSEEHTSELQSRFDLVCRLLLEKKNK